MNKIELQVVYDKKSNKSGVLLPRNSKEFYDNKGVCRYYYNSFKSANNWQTFDKHFIIIGSTISTEKFAFNSIIQFLKDNKLNIELQEFYKNYFGVEI